MQYLVNGKVFDTIAEAQEYESELRLKDSLSSLKELVTSSEVVRVDTNDTSNFVIAVKPGVACMKAILSSVFGEEYSLKHTGAHYKVIKNYDVVTDVDVSELNLVRFATYEFLKVVVLEGLSTCDLVHTSIADGKRLILLYDL